MELNNEQIEKLYIAIDSVHDVKIDVDESVEHNGKAKRLYNKLDKIEEMLYSIVERRYHDKRGAETSK